MGTRHLIGVVLDGDFKIAQYGQWDGYPDGQGMSVLRFLRDADLDDFAAKVRVVRFANADDEAEIAARWQSLGAGNDGWVTMEQSDAFYADSRFAPLNRDVGAGILDLVASGSVEFLHDSRDFGKDSLFCEWAYVIDLDRMVLECYAGFQKETPTTGRWAGQRDGEYGAVALATEFSLNELPADAEFISALDPEDVSA